MISSEQIAALKYLIFKTDANEISKQVLVFLIDQSDGLTRNVCLTLTTGRDDYTEEDIRAAAAVGAMLGANGTTHLNEILTAMGSKCRFSLHYGDFDPSRKHDPFNSSGYVTGSREGMPVRYTFWLADESYARKATLIAISRQSLGRIDIKKPELCPTLKSQAA